MGKMLVDGIDIHIFIPENTFKSIKFGDIFML